MTRLGSLNHGDEEMIISVLFYALHCLPDNYLASYVDTSKQIAPFFADSHESKQSSNSHSP